MFEVAIISPGLFPYVKGGAENQSRLIEDALGEVGRVLKLSLRINIPNDFVESDNIKILGVGQGYSIILTGLWQYCLLKKPKKLVFTQLNVFTFFCILFTFNKVIFLRLSNSGRLFDINRLFGGRLLFLKKLVLKKVNFFVAINPSIEIELSNLGFDNFVYISNAVEQTPVHTGECQCLVVISRFKRHKNLSFLPVLSRELMIDLPIKVYGEKTDDYSEIMEELNFCKKIEIMPKFYEKSVPYTGVKPVLIHPSLDEGTSNSILEALSMGVPVVANDILANEFLGKCGENGAFLLATSDVAEWARIIEKLFCDEEFYRHVSRNAICFINEYHRLDKIKEKWVNLVSK